MTATASAAEFSWLVRSKAGGALKYISPAQWAATHGAPNRVISALKAVPAASTGTADWAGDWAGPEVSVIFNSFSDSLKNQSVFYRLRSDNALTQIPFRARAALVTVGATAASNGEGRARLISRMTVKAETLQRRSATCIVVVTAELIDSIGRDGQALLAREVKIAVADEVDREFLAIVTAGAPTVASSGDTLADVQADLKRMLFAVPVGTSSALYWVASTSVSKGLVAMIDSTGANVFPAAGVLNGELWGLPLLTCSAMADDELILLDAHALAGNDDGFDTSTSSQADVDLAEPTTGDATTGTGSTLTSLYQTNSAAIKVVAYYGAEKLRTDAVVKLTGIGWAETGTA